jgi:hypothetical protein
MILRDIGIAERMQYAMVMLMGFKDTSSTVYVWGTMFSEAILMTVLLYDMAIHS